MLRQQFIDMLRCPETRDKLKLADESLLARLNEAIADGKLKNRVGQPVSHAIEAGLIREDGAVFYPISQEIPILLADEGIALSQLD